MQPEKGATDCYGDDKGRYYDTQGVLAMPGCVPVTRWDKGKGGIRLMENESLFVSH